MCLRQNRAEAATVVDHIKPHKLKEALNVGDKATVAKAQKIFWDKGNWQSLCKIHHDSTKQREEKRGRAIGCDENGMPLDPQSHWKNSWEA
ncbi:Phage-related protein [Erwinia pyrifoliae Ep1/96]|nr:Phage-related protein [Erwinia pyrifoliae Ep1/96]